MNLREKAIKFLVDDKWMDSEQHLIIEADAETAVETLKVFNSALGTHDIDKFGKADGFMETGHPEKAIELLSDMLGKDRKADLIILKYYLNKHVMLRPVRKKELV